MKYTIRELEAFSVIGQEIELTNFQRQNVQISTQFWKNFNKNLKKLYLILLQMILLIIRLYMKNLLKNLDEMVLS